MATHTIAKQRADFIQDHFFEWSFGRDDELEPDSAAFSKLDHPGDLHFLAAIYNWDDGPKVLEWILESPLCSRSTANLIFWKSLPSYFEDSDFNDPSTCPSYCEAGFALVPKVLKRYEADDFSPIEIEFDPIDEIEELDVATGSWTVPPGVYDVIDGITIAFEEIA